MELLCSHKEFDRNCQECVNGRDNKAEELEAAILKAYEDGGFRGVTHYVLKLVEEAKS